MATQTDPHAGQLSCVFLSPGTFFNEQTVVPVKEMDIAWAAEHAKNITERYGAKPYGFYFRKGSERCTGIHFVNGRIFTLDEVPDTPENQILRSNMRYNCPVGIENTNSFRFTTFFNEEDLLVSEEGVVVRRGDEPSLVQYRQKIQEALKSDGI